MSKRVLLAFMLAVGMIAVHGGDVDAHLAGTVYKPTYRHISSYDCTGTFLGVPNLDNHPALFRCKAIVTEFEILCANPQGKLTLGNSGPRLVRQEAEGAITEDDLDDKDKGRARKTLVLTDTVLTDADALCKKRNRNWFAVDEFVTKVDVFISSFDCPLTDPNCAIPGSEVPAFDAWVHCDRPINPANGLPYTLDPRAGNLPPPNGEDPNPAEYPCFPVLEFHCDAGDPCPIFPDFYNPSMFAFRQGGPEQPYSLNAGIHSLWKQARKALALDRSEPGPTELAQAMRNTSIM